MKVESVEGRSIPHPLTSEKIEGVQKVPMTPEIVRALGRGDLKIVTRAKAKVKEPDNG